MVGHLLAICNYMACKHLRSAPCNSPPRMCPLASWLLEILMFPRSSRYAVFRFAAHPQRHATGDSRKAERASLQEVFVTINDPKVLFGTHERLKFLRRAHE